MTHLLPLLTAKPLEVLAIGYTDTLPVRSKGIVYVKGDAPGASVINDPGGCPLTPNALKASLPPQPIYLIGDDSYWFPVGSRAKTLSMTRIGRRILNNCDLSFARGYAAINYFRKFASVLTEKEKKAFHYAYSGKGVDDKAIEASRKRKILFVFRQSRRMNFKNNFQ